MDCLLCTYSEDKKTRPYWEQIQKLVERSKNPRAANNRIIRYVLEAQRINLDIPLVRRYVPDGSLAAPELLLVNPKRHSAMNGHANGSVQANGTAGENLHPLQNGEHFLLEVVRSTASLLNPSFADSRR